MVAFNNQENGQPEQSSTDRAMEKIYEEMELIGRERMEQLMSSILELVSVQIESQQEHPKEYSLDNPGNGWKENFDKEGRIELPTEEVIDLVWDVHSEFFGV